jgi:hypothetical protein
MTDAKIRGKREQGLEAWTHFDATLQTLPTAAAAGDANH